MFQRPMAATDVDVCADHALLMPPGSCGATVAPQRGRDQFDLLVRIRGAFCNTDRIRPDFGRKDFDREAAMRFARGAGNHAAMRGTA